MFLSTVMSSYWDTEVAAAKCVWNCLNYQIANFMNKCHLRGWQTWKESRNTSSVSLISGKRWGRKCEVTKFICLATRVTFSDQVLIVYTEILRWQFSLRRMAWRLWKGTSTQLLCNCWSRRCQVRQATFADQSSFNCWYSVTASFETIYGLGMSTYE